nr:MAG TPA: hypothetical protein [Caudoviricetes sp.]
MRCKRSTCGNTTYTLWFDKLLNVITLMAIYFLGWLKCHPFIQNI